MRRGAFVTVVVPGDYGKPRPALVVQSDLFAHLDGVTVAPLTTHRRDDAGEFRLDVVPDQKNGLRETSQIAIDKIATVRADKIGGTIGLADEALMLRVSRALAVFLGVV